MTTRSLALSCCLLLFMGCPPPAGGERPPPSTDLIFNRVFPTTGSVVPRNVRIWYQPPEWETVYWFAFEDYSQAWISPPDLQTTIHHDVLRHDVDVSPGVSHPVAELVPKPVFGSDQGLMLYAAGQKLVVGSRDELLAEYTVGDFVDEVPPSPPKVQLTERTVVDGQPAARFAVAHDPTTLVVAARHPHAEPGYGVSGVTATSELLLHNNPGWVGTAVFDFFSIDVAGNWSTGVRVEVPNFSDESSDPGEAVPLDLAVWGPLMAEHSQGGSLTVEGIRELSYTVRHEALTAVNASVTPPCIVTSVALPNGWFDLEVTSPFAARCTLTIHGEAGGETATRTAEIELRSAGHLVQRERRPTCLNHSPAVWHFPNGTDVCRSADSDEAIWQLPDGRLKAVAGNVLTFLDPTHVLVSNARHCSAVDELGEETSWVLCPLGFVAFGVSTNPGLTPADTLPRVLTGSMAWTDRPIDLLRWDGVHLTADTKPNLVGQPGNGSVEPWGNDWAVARDVLLPPSYFSVVYSSATGDALWQSTTSAQVVDPWLRVDDQLYSAPGVALADRLPPGIRIRSVSGCFIGADTWPDRPWSQGGWSPSPYRGLWWFDVCSTPMRQAMTNTSELYAYLRVDSEGVWGQKGSGHWDFFGAEP